MQQLYQDSMAIVRKFGKPDLFITMTCNPKWLEIRRELLPGQQACDRPDLTSRIFRAKLNSLMKDIMEKHIFGIVVAKIHVIEFQKRGLPHAHILIILRADAKPVGPDDYDRFVSADIPDPALYPNLYNMISQHHLHRCSSRCKGADGQCSKKFPKAFNAVTEGSDDGYPLYKRTRDFVISKMVDNVQLEFNSTHVVPFNPYLLQKYNCHLNVEICSSVTSIKYIHKYCFKGSDRCMASLERTNDIDEIKLYVDARYIGASEATWRIFGFKLHDESHSVIR